MCLDRDLAAPDRLGLVLAPVLRAPQQYVCQNIDI